MVTPHREFGLVIHGGAGTILRSKMTPEKEETYRGALVASLQAGYKILAEGGVSLDAVQAAVNVMEDSPLFNAGKGAVFTHEGNNEQDATIMDGRTRQGGSVAALRRIKNPIDLARMVMERTGHVLLAGEGAELFAQSQGMELVDKDYFFTEHRWKQRRAAIYKEQQRAKAEHKSSAYLDHDGHLGTVGAVAVDKDGNLAAATSSGGMTNKKFGRIGDSAIVGAGTYADNETCAVSTTGHGEYFQRAVTAYDVSALMRYKGMTVQEALEDVIQVKLSEMGGTGGAIAIDAMGNTAWSLNTEGMYRGMLVSGGEMMVEIFRDG